MTQQATFLGEDSDTLLRRFDSAAEQDPSAVAVRSGQAAMTYGTLARTSHALTERLAPLMADRTGPVATLLEPGPHQISAALAAMRCGRPYLPIDLSYPQHRIDRILSDAAPAALISGPDMPPDVTAGRWGNETRVTPEDAYVIYTSGSTGNPKGVVIQHRGILNLLDESQARRTLAPRSRYSTCASLGFDAAVLEAWTSLTTGGELVVTPDACRWHPADFARWLADEEIAHAYVPAAFLPAMAQGLRDGLDLRCLQRIIVAVEPIPRGLLGEIKRALPDLTLINGYGPTEAAVCVSMYEVSEQDEGPERTPIGTAIRGTDLLVEPLESVPEPEPEHGAGRGAGHEQHDAESDDASSGLRGELHIGGVGVGRTIRPEEGEWPVFYTRTAEDGTRLPYYRTGDIVRVDGDGVHTFLGRVDHMIKIRGYRVEPGDVEHALLAQPGVGQALVLKRPAESPDGAGAGADQLVAYVVPTPGASIDLAEVHRGLRERLPWYAVPHKVVVREAFPLTAHGKVDRAALAADTPRPVLTPPPSEHPQDGEVDPELLRLWHDVLGGASGASGAPDPRLSFLANGGDSLAAGRMAAELTRRLGRPVRVLDILLTDDLGDLQEAVSQTLVETAPYEEHDGPPRIRAAQPGEPVPATYGQRGLWFHDSLHPGSTVYNEPLTLRLRGTLDVAALFRALDTIVERHEALRTDLAMVGGELRQTVRPAAPLEPATADLRTVPAAARAAAVEEAVRAAVRQPFDLSRGPHLRAHLLRCGDADHLLVLSLHHSAFDGASADILFEELSALYGQFTTGTETRLAAPPSQYADFAMWQHELIDGGHVEEDVAYWREQLAGLPDTMDLPTDFPRPQTASGDGGLVRDHLPAELTARVEALAREAGATRYTAFLAVLQTLLSRYCATDDVVVGAPFSGRDQPGTAGAVGYYLNMLPLRADLGGSPSFRRLLARTRQTVTDAYTHQQAPYGLLLEELHGASQVENPYLQVCLVPEDIYRHEMNFAGIESTFEYHDIGIAKFDLTVNLIPDPKGGLRLTAEYRTDLFRAATVERLLGHFRTLLESATAEPDVPVSELPMLTRAEQVQILGTFANGTAVTGPAVDESRGVGVHDLVDRWAARTPDAVAVAADGEELSYRELVRRADQLAHYLAERGAEPDCRIGVCLPRGTDAVVAFLAVLKTGSAYVPLDPAYPAHRLSFMAEDADLVIELTEDLLREDREAIAHSPARAPAVGITGEDIAYVIYTSGSTGKPKGVQVPHRAVVDLALGAPHWAGIDPETRLLLVASLSFDLVTFDIWGTLVNGARLVLPPAGTVTPDQLASHIVRHGVTHADMPTALFHRQAEADPASLARLSTVLVGGEVLNPALAARVLEAGTGSLRLINAYGPTEATTYATYHAMTGPDDVTEPIAIGRPTPNTRVRILDSRRQPVPVGVTGELHLGGPGLAGGYLNRPETTAERFVQDPFGDAGERLYGTGDLTRWRPDGTIDYVGRLDEQLKMHGFRVEPGDIEAALRAHPDVTHAVVTRREDRPGGPYLAAYYTTTPGSRVSAGELTDLAGARLPDYMVPRVLTELDSFPVTEGGKIDRAALPVPAGTREARDAQATDGSRTARLGQATRESGPDGLAPVQEQIAEIWHDVLAVDEVDPDERLFDMGGASLHVTLIHQRVAGHFGLSRLRMIDLFSHPTLRAYAAHVHRLCLEDGEEAENVEERAGERR